MGFRSPQDLSACLLEATQWLNSANHLAAIEHRQTVTRAWGIPPGSSVLEIGPGQGILTVVLADAVGPTGCVVAVDNALLDWGALTSFSSSSSPSFLLSSLTIVIMMPH